MKAGSIAKKAAAAALIFSAAATAGAEEQPPPTLPPAVAALMKKHKIPQSRAAIVVHRVGGSAPLVFHRALQADNPASVIKLPLTFAALDLLGADYQWKTSVAYRGKMEGGELHGDLILRGGGDPYLTLDRFLVLLSDLRGRGLRSIHGKVIVDDSLFSLPPHDSGAFDGASNKPYNAAASAMAVNFNAQRIIIAPQGKTIHAYLEPPNDNFVLKNQMRDGRGRCSNWRGRLREIYRGDSLRTTLSLKGIFPARCGQQSFHASALTHAANAAGVFGALWRRMGGEWSGEWQTGVMPPDAKVIAEIKSPPLADIARAMNKHSNNVIARNLFISLDEESPKTVAGGRKAFSQWMREQGIGGDFFADNGSGLSRDSHLSAGQLFLLMQKMHAHPLRAEMVSSLPVLGVDGTTKKRLRKSAKEGGHLKTGSLNGVTNIAGFVRGEDGEDIIFICFIEKQSSRRAKRFQDALMLLAHRGKL